MILKRMKIQFYIILNMDEINKTKLSEQTKFRLDEISKIEN